MNIYLVIPTFNEGKRLKETLSKVKKYFPIDHTIVIDDGSRQPVIFPKSSSSPWLLRHRINLGKGAAMRTGAEFAFSKNADAIIFMDSDGQHNPKEISSFVSHLKQGYDLVFGVRSFGQDAPLTRYMGRKLTAVYISILFGMYIPDILSGFRALTKKAYQKVIWQSNHYEVETEMVARLGKNGHGLKWTNIPIETIYQFKYKGMTLIDGIKLFFNSLIWKFF